MEKHHQHSKGMDKLQRMLEFLDNSERRKTFPPEELLKMLPMKKTDSILDLGAGSGYFTIPAAHMVEGLVYALDLNPKMLKVIEAKAKIEKLTNIQLVNGSINDIPLSECSVDIVLASLVLHEVNPLSKTLQETKRVLKEGGYFLCFEYEKTESTVDGPPMHIRIPSSTMEQELLDLGFTITQKVFPTDYSYIIIAKK